MSVQAPIPEYDCVQTEARSELSPASMVSRMAGCDMEFHLRISYDKFPGRRSEGKEKQISHLAIPADTQFARNVATPPNDFARLLASLADQVARVLAHEDDPVALEHHAVLFWPAMNALHPFLGMDLRGDELIAACDVFRSQFRLRPVPPAALVALENVLRSAASATILDVASVDGWLDQLEAAGVDQRFPLTFESSNAG